MNSLLIVTALLNDIFTICLEEIDLVNSPVNYHWDLQCHFRGEGGMMQSDLYSNIVVMGKNYLSVFSFDLCVRFYHLYCPNHCRYIV